MLCPPCPLPCPPRVPPVACRASSKERARAAPRKVADFRLGSTPSTGELLSALRTIEQRDVTHRRGAERGLPNTRRPLHARCMTAVGGAGSGSEAGDSLAEITPGRRVFRVGRKPNPWAWPPWEIAGEDGTFGNRWDDARSTYRVLYGSSQLEACFVETLARFRPDPHVLAELARIKGPEAVQVPGRLPRSWLNGRVVGEAS